MWVLESEGDLFNHRRTWLRPGQKYLFGRTKVDTAPDQQNLVISHKSVSRKHLVIAVSPVKPGDSEDTDSRSAVSITDESKLGTELDGQRFVNESRTLSKKEHRIKLADYGTRISWEPAIFTLALPNKDQDGEVNVLDQLRVKLAPLDIKIISPYLVGETTHVIANKRNVPKGLQALINGKYIVTEAYVDAVTAVGSSPGVADDGESPLPSLLEQDIVANWPDAIKFLPQSGKEPVKRPAELFAPNPGRIELLEGFTFIFADERQYDSLNPALTNAGAKALLYDLKLGLTKLSDFVAYVRDIAQSKGIRNFADARSDKAVIVVRFRGKKETERWALDFLRELDGELGQRSVEQNEFLDAILTNNASALKRPLEEAESPLKVSSTAPEMSRTTESFEALSSSNTIEQSPAQLTKRPGHRVRRTITKSRFKGFDDFDVAPPSASKHSIEHEERPSIEEAESAEIESQGLFVSQPDSPLPAESNNRKRLAAEEADGENEADMMDELLPAARAMKKRRIEEERAGTAPVKNSAEPETLEDTFRSNQTATKEPVDVRSAARSHAEELDARNRSMSHRHSEEPQPTKEEIAAMRNLAIVEEWEPPPRGNGPASRTRSAVQQHRSGQVDSRWDDQWNGRKNFKKFRKQGQAVSEEAGAARRAARVMIPLEEFHKPSISDSYWLEDSARHTAQSSASQNTRSTQPFNASTSQLAIHTQQSAPAEGTPAQEVIEVVDSEEEEEEEGELSGTGLSEADAQQSTSSGRRRGPRSGNNNITQSSVGTNTSVVKGTQQQQQPSSGSNVAVRGSQLQSTSSGSTMARSTRASKRQHQPPLSQTRLGASHRSAGNDDDDDEDEHLRFKFRRRDD